MDQGIRNDQCKITIITKGQIILKSLYGVFNSSKKQKKTIGLEVPNHSSKVEFFLSFFLGELKIPKRHFEVK